MDYPRYDFQYPSADYQSDDTIYLASPYTKWPDFAKSEAVNCGGALGYVSITGLDEAEEALCLFVRSPFLTSADSLITVRYSYHDGVTEDGEDPLEVRARGRAACRESADDDDDAAACHTATVKGVLACARVQVRKCACVCGVFTRAPRFGCDCWLVRAGDALSRRNSVSGRARAPR
jgi:hypothetical protein